MKASVTHSRESDNYHVVIAQDGKIIVDQFCEREDTALQLVQDYIPQGWDSFSYESGGAIFAPQHQLSYDEDVI